MSGRNITLLKVAGASALQKVVSLGGKYLSGSGRLGKSVVKGMGGGSTMQGLGTAAGVTAGVAAPILLARKTNVGRKVERGIGKGLGEAGRLSERALTAKDWGMRPGETY